LLQGKLIQVRLDGAFNSRTFVFVFVFAFAFALANTPPLEADVSS